MIIGIFSGLLSATSQSVSYLCSRIFQAHYQGKSLHLLTLSHIAMGFLSIPVLFTINALTPLPPVSSFIEPLVTCTLFYLCGQTGLQFALRSTEASRIAPLMGIKIVILALLTIVIQGASYTGLQWISIILCFVAATLLNSFGGSLPLKTVGWVLFTTTSYCLADINIKRLVTSLGHLGLFTGATAAVSLTFIMSMLLGLGVLPFLRSVNTAMWKRALPFTLSWYIAAILLFAAFGSIGVVFGNIIQSTRGIISIVIGVIVSFLGHTKIEKKAPLSLIVRRGAAALLMSAAIGLFYLNQLFCE